MSRKKVPFKYKKERAVLSDTLPYEIPITFSNRFFYEFLLENGVEYINSNIQWRKSDKATDAIIRLLFGIYGGVVKSDTKKIFDENQAFCSFDGIKKNSFPSIPFGYKISHKDKEYRDLVVCHPRNQLQMVDFYHTYKEAMLHYCTISPFSIRRPQKISKYIYFKDKTHYDTLSDDSAGIEVHDKEYENLRSFFVYKDYSNIYKFYESYKYHRCEKKYNKLLKLDISKCFDSIYTHSISWALINKEAVKENVNQSKETFGGRFDALMQSLNYNETNGIIIGPEFSRIFAELILQSVDRSVHLSLSQHPYNKFHKRDYEVFRYVDDYFIFYNDEETKDKILEVLQIKLREFKLYLNSSKAVTYEKPIITEITIANQKIAHLFEAILKYKIEDDGVEKEGEEGKEEKEEKKGSIYINAKNLITQFKTIIKESNVAYKDMLNYSLAIVENKSVKIIRDYEKIHKTEKSEKELTKAILEILDFVFFIYSVSPRVNTTIKLCRILRVFTAFLGRKEANKDFRHLVYKLIYDNLSLVLKKSKNNEHTQVETLYLLVVLSELGKNYWLEEDTLSGYLNIYKDKSGKYSSHSEMNYFSITVLLFYMREKKRYSDLREYVEAHILEKFERRKNLIWKDTELTLLLMDSLVCPYLSMDCKRELLNKYGFTNKNLQTNIIRKRRYWFTKWTDFDFGKELDAKRSQEVY